MEKASLLVFVPSKCSVLSAPPSFPLDSVCELWDLVDAAANIGYASLYTGLAQRPNFSKAVC